VSPLKIKIPVKANKYTNYSFSLLIMYGISYMFRHYIVIFTDLRSPRTTPLNTTRPSTIFYRMFLNWTSLSITLPSSRSVPSVFWEMLNWGAADRIVWMGVLQLVTWCVVIWNRHAHAHPQYPIDCSSIEQLSEGTRNAPWGWQCNAETCRSYHT
jgi:hypothetical protein